MVRILFLRHLLQSAAAVAAQAPQVAALLTELQEAAAVVVAVVTPLTELHPQAQGQQIKEIQAGQAIAQHRR